LAGSFADASYREIKVLPGLYVTQLYAYQTWTEGVQFSFKTFGKKSFPNFKDRASGRRKAPLTELESVRLFFFFALLLFSRRETRQLGEGGETMNVAILVLCVYVLAWYGTPPCVV
jgi:hypothetical protein